MIKITDYKGYTINYNEMFKRFELVGEDAEKYEAFNSQEEAEKRVDVLTKAEFRRVPIIREGDGYLNYPVQSGEITSVNIEDKSAWASFSGKREKLNFQYDVNVYQKNEHNEAVASELRSKRDEIKKLNKEIEIIKTKFTDKITLEYLKEQK